LKQRIGKKKAKQALEGATPLRQESEPHQNPLHEGSRVLPVSGCGPLGGGCPSLVKSNNQNKADRDQKATYCLNRRRSKTSTKEKVGAKNVLYEISNPDQQRHQDRKKQNVRSFKFGDHRRHKEKQSSLRGGKPKTGVRGELPLLWRKGVSGGRPLIGGKKGHSGEEKRSEAVWEGANHFGPKIFFLGVGASTRERGSKRRWFFFGFFGSRGGGVGTTRVLLRGGQGGESQDLGLEVIIRSGETGAT